MVVTTITNTPLKGEMSNKHGRTGLCDYVQFNTFTYIHKERDNDQFGRSTNTYTVKVSKRCEHSEEREQANKRIGDHVS